MASAMSAAMRVQKLSRGVRAGSDAEELVVLVMNLSWALSKLAPVVEFVYTTFSEYHLHVSCF